MLFYLFIIFSSFFSTQVFSQKKTKCSLAYVKFTKEDFWNANEFVVEINGKKFQLTYSFDSELPHPDVFRLIQRAPKTFEKMKTNYPNLIMPLSDIEKLTGLSVKQIKSPFGLRKDAKISSKGVHVFDLQPSLILKLIESEYIEGVNNPASDLSYIPRYFEPYVDQATKELRLPTHTHQDNGYIELTHSSYDQKPSRYKETVENLHRIAKNPMTHMHVGLPHELGENKLKEIAQFVEARMIYKLVEEGGEDELAFTGYSAIGKFDNFDVRGIMKVAKKEFTKPYLSWDVELRQYFELEEGLENIRVISTLAKEHEKLNPLKFKPTTLSYDGVTLNLKGFTEYMSVVLRRHSDPKIRDLADEFANLFNSIKDVKNITTKEREQVKEILRGLDLDEVLPMSLILKSE